MVGASHLPVTLAPGDLMSYLASEVTCTHATHLCAQRCIYRPHEIVQQLMDSLPNPSIGVSIVMSEFIELSGAAPGLFHPLEYSSYIVWFCFAFNLSYGVFVPANYPYCVI